MRLVELEWGATWFVKGTWGHRSQDVIEGLAELVWLIRIAKECPPQCGPPSWPQQLLQFGQTNLLVDPVKGGGGYRQIEIIPGNVGSSKLEITTSRLAEAAAWNR
jgi:hypothetical protein